MKKLISLVLAILLCFTGFTTLEGAASGSTVKVEARKIDRQEDSLDIKIIYPFLEGFKAASQLNDIIQKRNISAIGAIKEAQTFIDDLKATQKADGEQVTTMKAAVESYFDYNFSGNILSILINSYDYYGGAHGSSYMDSYSVNTKTNEIYNSFNSLFNSGSNYKKAVLDKLNRLIDKNKDLYFEDAKKSVAAKNSNYKFYIDGNKLVIYFDLYELRPYAGGIPVFEINAGELKGLLKNDVYSQMIAAKPLEKVRFNGTSLSPQLKTYEQEYVLMVPLQDIAKLLGYKVTWDAKKGWGVGGGFVKNKESSFYSSKTNGSVNLGLAAKAVGNTMYVPQSYFSMVLKEDVYYYGDALRIYRINPANQNTFEKQIVELVSPKTSQEAVNMYAAAVKERKGAIQYALYSDALKAARKADLEDLNWVTGVSSPWVSGYEIKNTGKDSYAITFHWATSTGKAGDSVTSVKAEKISGQDYWQITEVKE
ncbi:peptidoglycan-N-acetylmuramic acid deacetylase PdaC [Ruminiclostridium hungatei]|uniref:Peptidoglycan-N-acetylmuramic acid deacetylase PdaC n=1 Tax=Ruminiclostridium hungatei TaxID=48256 RepID=A0A1V4SJR1_RUMHU|nr:DUF3298 domain-containing protein [Ruminiclostridium hungatei]OPX43481.1 peptidoglycan-N-acetylmuramic acid deacetylase PdaC [Ruminiclostridium hungatei]